MPGGLGLLPVILISNCPVPVLSQSPGLDGSTQILLTVRVPVAGTTVFVIVHVRCCPAAMVPVASCELEEDCIQSPEKEGVKPKAAASLTVKEPPPSITDWLPPLLIEKEVVRALLPVTCTLKEGLPGQDPPPDITQDFLINKVPVDGFEFDTGLPAPTVSQFAFCLVSCFSILESANTIGTFIMDIPVTNIPTLHSLEVCLNTALSIYKTSVSGSYSKLYSGLCISL